jgi:hypothetical protein
MVSPQYIQLIKRGPFPKHIDPWAEKGHYFHQLHAHMITYMLDAMSEPLLELGYVAGREASLQITEQGQPDIFVRGEGNRPSKLSSYSQAAAEAQLEVGVAIETPRLELDRIFIKSRDLRKLVTVIEIISPNNKTKYEEMVAYRQRREQLLIEGVHCVEIDLTRSIRRLLDNLISEKFPYHIAIHLHDEDSRFIGIQLTETPKSFALPLRAEIIPVQLDNIYLQAYARLSIALQLYEDGHYIAEHLPFPSTLSEDERKILLEQVETWKLALKEAEG